MESQVQQALGALKQGPVAVVINPSTDNLLLCIRDGVDITIPRSLENAEVDALGRYDIYLGGEHMQAEFTVPESSMDALLVMFPDQTDGTTYLGIGRSAGLSLRSIAKHIRIRPWATRTESTCQVDIWKGVPGGDGNLSMKKTEPFGLKQQIVSLPDLTKPDGELHGRITFASRS